MTHQRRAAILIAAALFAAALSSCTRKLGWGVVLWSSTEGPLPAGTIVPVYIKSNIQSVYVVGVPKSGEKVELPLWQVVFSRTKSKARSRVEAFGNNLSLYMIAARDGVPLRTETTNNAKRVYRLREGEAVKVLRKVKGEAVRTGDENLAGDWYEVLAEGGVVGYVFSYAMRIYDETKEGPPILASAVPLSMANVGLVFSRSWKPLYFQEMIDDERIDLDLFALYYGLYTDATRRQIRIELPGVSEIFNYSSIAEAGGYFSFVDTPLRIKVASDRRIDVVWTDSSALSLGEPDVDKASPEAPATESAIAKVPATPSAGGSGGRASFVVLSTEPRAIIQAEELRQQRALEAFVGAMGGSWTASRRAPDGSDVAVTLSVAKSRRFTWSGREALSPGFLPQAAVAGPNGNVAFRLYLAPALAKAWDGAFSLVFDPPAEGGKPARVDLLYKKTESGMSIVPALLGEAGSGTDGAAGIVATGADSRFEPFALDRTN